MIGSTSAQAAARIEHQAAYTQRQSAPGLFLDLKGADSSTGWWVAGGIALAVVAGAVTLGMTSRKKPRRRVEIYEGKGRRRYMSI